MMNAPASRASALTHAEVRSIINGIMLAMLLAALDQTIVATAMPTIGRELGDIEHLPWVVTIYLLAATVVTPLYGKASDIWGRRVTLLVAIGVFVIGSIACALAPTMLVLIIARGMQGLGGGGLISLAQTIIGDIVAPRERPRYQAYIASVFATSSIAGPVLGGFLAEHLHWSLIFWINVPLGLAAFWMTNALLRRLPRHERPHKLDFGGAGLMALATITLLLALSWGGARYPWISAPILALIGMSAALWLAFALRLKTAPEPLIPTELLQNRVMTRGTLAACFGMGTLIGLTIYMPIYFELVLGLTASGSGIALIPLMVGTVAGATISGRLMARVTHYKRLPMAGLAAAVAALVALGLWPHGLPLWAVELLLAITSLGLGTLLPVTTVAIQNAVKFHQLGTATATMNFFRSLGGAFVVAAFGAIMLGGGVLLGLPEFTPETFAAGAAQGGVDLAPLFGGIFLAAALGLAVALGWLVAMEERPLRSAMAKAAETTLRPGE